jgi:hypothetical protein
MLVVLMLEALLVPDALVTGDDRGNAFIFSLLFASWNGFTGHFFYMRRAEKAIKTAKAKFTLTEERMLFLNKKAGVSYLIFILITALMLLLFGYDYYLA